MHRAVQVRPGLATLAAAEPTLAGSALDSCPGAVAAWDKVSILSASMVFTMDTSANMFTLHSIQVSDIFKESAAASTFIYIYYNELGRFKSRSFGGWGGILNESVM